MPTAARSAACLCLSLVLSQLHAHTAAFNPSSLSSRLLSWSEPAVAANHLPLEQAHVALEDPIPNPDGGHVLFRDEERQLRLAHYAARAFPDSLGSKNRASKALKRGSLLLNDVPNVEGCRRVRRGDVLLLRQPPPVPPVGDKLKAQVKFVVHCLENGLKVVYEDDDVAAVYKPAGIHTKHKTNFRYLALEDALPAILTPPTSDSTVTDRLPLPLAAHRLDVRVCGLVLVAKTGTAMRDLSAQFESRGVRKRYEALVVGRPPIPERGEMMTVDTPIFVEGRGTLPSRTTLRLLSQIDHEHWGALSHVELRPETGRTHQLRVHCAGIGCPIVGDDLYWDAGEVARRSMAEGMGLGGPAHHSGGGGVERLPPVRRGGGLYLQSVGASFLHPRTRRKMLLDVPAADKFGRLLDKARRANNFNEDVETAAAA